MINYCDPSSTIFRVDEQKFYNKVCRQLVGYYLRTEGPLKILTSKKEHKTMKVDHLRIYRYLLNDLKHYSRTQIKKRRE